MGTTDTALRSGSGVFGFTLLIEGYPKIITSAADLDAVVDAYADEDWDEAISGLEVIGGIKQSIEPLKEELDKPELTFRVTDCDGTDHLGKALWKTKPTISSRLDDLFEPGTDGSGTLTVKSNTGFATSGVGYLGTKRISYTAVVGGTGFTIPPGGANTFDPLGADTGNTYARPHGVATGGTFDVAAPTRFSDVPATWHGKKVALYIHRIVDGVWDTRAEARLEFAGKLVKFTDGAPGVVTLHCRDLRYDVENAVLLKNQWVGYVKPGIYLTAGDGFRAVERDTAPGLGRVESAPLLVVASGASGTDEVNEGIYEYSEFLAILTRWLSADPTLNGTWSAQLQLTANGWRTVFRAKFGTDSLRDLEISARVPRLMDFMGFPDAKPIDRWITARGELESGSEHFIVSPSAPYRSLALQQPHQTTNMVVDLLGSDGVWFDDLQFAPGFLQEISDGLALSYVRIGTDQLAVANYSSATRLTKVTPVAGFGTSYGDGEGFKLPGITFDDEAENLEVRQVVFLSGAFHSIMVRLFASIGGTPGVNHAVYDHFPWGVGMPWAVLGDDFVQSCKSLEQASGTSTISVVLDKPTPFRDILLPEMLLRFAFLVFKDGGYRFVSPPVPSALTPDHVLDETNKAIEGGKPPPSRSEWSSELMVNVIKIRHSRDLKGEFRGAEISIQNQSSIDAHGKSELATIDAVNCADDRSGLYASTVRHLAADLAADLLVMFGKPLKIVTRTLAPTHYHAAPGDTAALSDDVVRDPASGERGIANRACVVLSTFHDYGQGGGVMSGEATLLLSDEDRTFPLGPAAEVDTGYTSGLYTDGYDSTNFRLALKAHSFSKATESVDATHFDAADLVRVVEMDPADPSTIDAWSRVVASVQSAVVPYYLQLTAGISGPAWSGATKTFGVIPQSFASCQASQKLHAFQADDGDGMIQDVAEPNLFGSGSPNSIEVFATGNASDLPSLLADELAGDGVPLTPLQMQSFARMHNNLIHYKTATHRPLIAVSPEAVTSTEYELLYYAPLYLGALPGIFKRYLRLAPMLKSDNAARTAYVRITSSSTPPLGASVTDYSYKESTRSVEFSTAATVPTIASIQDLMPVLADGGYTWISVEARISAPGTATLYGIPTQFLKAGA
jgi:hypothetical protein